MSRRACESCRIRKVKCSSGQPCSQCAQLGLPCAVVAGRPKRNNPVRGRLIAKARGEDDDDSARSLPPVAPSLASFSPAFFFDLLPAFEQLVYPFNPVICPDDLYHAIHAMDDSVEDRALVFAFAAATVFLAADETSNAMLSPSVVPSPGRRAARTQVETLVQHSLDAHKRLDSLHGLGGAKDNGDNEDDGMRTAVAEEPPVTIKRIVTCIFLEISMMGFRNYTRSFSLLREAITMLQIIQVRHPATAAGSGEDAARYQRLYWEAFIHERFLTIAAGYPSILPPLPGTNGQGHKVSLLPDPTVPAHIKLGFGRLVQLFLVMDEQFLKYWGQQGPGQTTLGDDDASVAVAWIEAKQAQLDIDEAEVQQIANANANDNANMSDSGLTELQHADLFITRLWLRTLVWQLALARGLLRSDPAAHYHPGHSGGHNAVHEGLSLHFPAQRLSAQLRLLVSRLASVASIGQQGSGIVQKLFEITSTIADVLTLPRSIEQQETIQREGYEGYEGQQTQHDVTDFVFLVQFVSQFARIREQQKAYLWDKVDQLRAQHGLESAGGHAV
ncbi:hypothetical protein Sste5346_006942 [Sporothrix stenoceras]|uniref:Zn(2)-C6 fungal-type domain-containing protein n=1 Tax=Sporothrix stenoceras TaxID=5173 RepID=A0ABR3YWA5_9PEZI